MPLGSQKVNAGPSGCLSQWVQGMQAVLCPRAGQPFPPPLLLLPPAVPRSWDPGTAATCLGGPTRAGNTREQLPPPLPSPTPKMRMRCVPHQGGQGLKTSSERAVVKDKAGGPGLGVGRRNGLTPLSMAGLPEEADGGGRHTPNLAGSRRRSWRPESSRAPPDPQPRDLSQGQQL